MADNRKPLSGTPSRATIDYGAPADLIEGASVAYFQSGKAAAVWGLLLILAATLFPFDFSFDEWVDISEEFSLGGALKARGNDLIIGADGAFNQAFRGRIGELRICRDALTSDQVAKEAQAIDDRQADDRLKHSCSASYFFNEFSG